jgi:hypothetical protein
MSMATTAGTLAQWLNQAGISAERLTVQQEALLQAAFRFRQRVGQDYYSTRLLSHFLLHCDSGLPVAQIGRLLDMSRPTASRQQGLFSKEVVQAAHHRMAGRPHGKLLPRYAGPIAQFILSHPDATRFDTLDFIHRTWNVRVSTVALFKFVKKYGLDQASRATAEVGSAAQPRPAAESEPAAQPGPAAQPMAVVPPGPPAPLPAPPFSAHTRTAPVPSC